MSRGECLPRVIAIYIALCAVITLMPSWYSWWRDISETTTPGPSPLTQAAALAEQTILLLWFPVSFFVWRREAKARWLIASSALALGIAQCMLYSRILNSYGSLDLVGEALVLAVPTFFFSAVVFCPLVGQTFSHRQLDGTPSI